MKNLKSVSNKSKNAPVKLYYNFSDNSVNTSGAGHLVTTLIRYNTPVEIEKTVNKWKNL